MTSKSSVVDDHEHNEGGVEDGEGDEELVEGVAHLLTREDNVYIQYTQCIYTMYTIQTMYTLPERTATEIKFPARPTAPTIGIKTP